MLGRTLAGAKRKYHLFLLFFFSHPSAYILPPNAIDILLPASKEGIKETEGERGVKERKPNPLFLVSFHHRAWLLQYIT